MSINVIGCLPYGSIGFVFDAASPGICSCGGIDVAEEFSFAVVAIMARVYAVAMCPTVAILFFWSGLQCPKAYSLWGGVVPSPSIG